VKVAYQAAPDSVCMERARLRAIGGELSSDVLASRTSDDDLDRSIEGGIVDDAFRPGAARPYGSLLPRPIKAGIVIPNRTA
jgi:hypothetical protein